MTASPDPPLPVESAHQGGEPPHEPPHERPVDSAGRARDDLVIAFVVAALACALALGGWAWRLDRVVYDLGLTLWRRPPPPDITIVDIDDASVAAIGRWPWRRAVHATLLQRLALARPRAVALDLVLSEADPEPLQDALLAQALAQVQSQAAPVVLPVAWQVGATGSALPVAAVEPIPQLRATARLGASEAPVDADGVLRRAFLHAGPPEALYPHLALALLQVGGEDLPARLPTEADSDASPVRGWVRTDSFLIRYAGPPGSVDRVSYVDVLTGNVPAQRLAGRYLLVGSTALGLGDTLATPVNHYHQAMPGIEVLAHTLYTLRSGDTVRTLPDAQLAALSAALLVALVFSFGRLGPKRALPAALVSAPLALGLSLWALGGGWWINPVPYMLPALLAYPLWSWRRLERAVAGIEHEIARLAGEQLSERRAAPRERNADVLDSRLQALQDAGALLRQARRFLADTLAAMPTAMLVADGAARVVLANPRAATLFEVESAQELLQLDLVRLLGEFRAETGLDWRATVAALRPGGEGVAVEATLAGGGDYVVHVAAVDLQGLRRLIVTVADVEPVKQAQRQREEVLAFVSHDLRSPATSIVLLADLQLQGRAPAPTEELLREVRRLAARTLEMSESFVRAAQVQTRTLSLGSVALAALVEEALADLRPQARAAQVSLAVQAGPGAVVVDRLLVARAIANLVSNAVKHSRPQASVEVEARLDGGALRVQVRDHGPGLTPDQLQQLAQGDRGADVRDARGVGLGLLFVQRVARRHGGHLDGRNADVGAVFELVIPAHSGNP